MGTNQSRSTNKKQSAAEFQSTNEELEASREKTQSLNEELSAVNCQLQEKVTELEATNNDLSNLLVSTNIATIFLDTELRIRRFTPASKGLLNLIPGDVGRPVTDLSPRVHDPELLQDMENVLEKLTPLEKEVESADGRWYVRRVLPYRTTENTIDGVVITFSDISQFKAASEQIRIRERQQAVVAQLGRSALTGIDLQSLFDRAVTHLTEVLGVEYCKLLELLPDGETLLLRAGIGWRKGLVGKAIVSSGLHSQAGFALHSAAPVIVEDLNAENRFEGPSLLIEHGVVSGMSVLIEGRDKPFGVLGAHTKHKVKFTVDDVNFLQAVANVLAEAIAHEAGDQALKESERRAKEKEERLRLALDAGQMGTWQWEPATNHGVWDAGEERLLGFSEGEFDGDSQRFFERVHPADIESLRSAIDKALATNGDYNSEFRIRRVDGEIRWLVGIGRVIRNDETGQRSLIGVNFDITERKRAEERLRESEEWLQTIADSVPVMISYVDNDLRYRFNNQYYGQWYRRPPEEMKGKHVREVLGEASYAVARPHMEAVLKGEPQSFEMEAAQLTGSHQHVQVQYVPHRDENRDVIGFFTVVQDITNLVRSSVQVAMLEASESERRRISQDLHDTTGQVLTGLAYMTQSLYGSLRDKAPAEAKIAKTMAREFENAVGQIRRVVRGLMPVEFDEHGLMAGLEELVHASCQQYGIECTFHCEETVFFENRDVAVQLYRIAQEALTNAHRHANAGRVTVRLEKRDGTLELEIRDNGIGLPQPLKSGGMGLKIMRYRAERIGARLRIQNAENGGTRVVCHLPSDE